MATLEDAQAVTSIGGLGCEGCIYWTEYSSMGLSLNGFVGRWGRCVSKKQIDDINRRQLIKRLTSTERVNTNINRLNVSTVILSTTPTFNCTNMKIPVDAEDKKGNGT
jgi:hypothetical protein